MIVLGITGGIAGGKSTVAAMFLQEGDVHINADAVVHDLFAEDTTLISAVAGAFPDALHNGTIDRAVLGARVANDSAALKKLETIEHPAVRDEQTRRIEKAREEGCKLVVLDVPLMFESGADALCDTVVTVQATPEIQRVRAMERPGMNEAKLEGLMARQLDDASRAARADAVIRTDCSIEETRRAVELLRPMLFNSKLTKGQP